VSESGSGMERRGGDQRKRMEFVEKMLVTQTRTTLIVRQVMEKFGCSDATVYGDIKRIQESWKREDRDFGVEARREQLRRSAQDLYKRCIDKKRVIRGADGEPIRDSAGNLVHEDSLNESGAARVLELLAKMDGLLTIRVESRVQEATEAMLEALKVSMEPEIFAKVIDALAQMNAIDATPSFSKLPPDSTPAPVDPSAN
jgi:hypothetical protein